jgi:hypothetical protein
MKRKYCAEARRLGSETAVFFMFYFMSVEKCTKLGEGVKLIMNKFVALFKKRMKCLVKEQKNKKSHRHQWHSLSLCVFTRR